MYTRFHPLQIAHPVIRPAAQFMPFRPTYAPRVQIPQQLGQSTPTAGQKGVASGLFLLNAVLNGVVGYVGGHVGLTGKGLTSALGWVAGIYGTLGALGSLAGLVRVTQLPTQPPAETTVGPNPVAAA